MKLFLLSAFLFSVSFVVNAQQYFETDASYKADVILYIVDDAYKADVLVYKTNESYKASKDGPIWYFVSEAYKADKLLYFTNSSYKAHLKVYFVDAIYKAKWKSDQLKHLLE